MNGNDLSFPFIVGSPHEGISVKNNFDPYRVRRERIRLKLDALCELCDQLPADDPERDQLLCQIEALNIAHNVEF